MLRSYEEEEGLFKADAVEEAQFNAAGAGRYSARIALRNKKAETTNTAEVAKSMELKATRTETRYSGIHAFVRREEEEEEEEEGLFRANAVSKEDPERDCATQV